MIRWNDEVRKPEMVMHYPWFEVKGDLLYQTIKRVEEGEEVTRLLFPTGYLGDLLWIAHSLPIGCNLGWDKTKAWLLKRFFWPGIYKELEKFCITGTPRKGPVNAYADN